MKQPKSPLADFEAALSVQPIVKLRLYIGGTKPKSNRALRQIKEICEQRLRGRYELEVIDVFQQPAMAKDDGIIAVPTLIRWEPLPRRKLIGDLSDVPKVLKGLGILKEEEKP